MLPTPPTTPLRHWVPGGGAPTAAHLNEPVDWINNFRIAVGMTDEGIPPIHPRPMIGKIIAAGPNGEADLGTESPRCDYWVAEQWIEGTSLGSPGLLSTADASANEDYIHRVTNLSEVQSDTHLLKVGCLVVFWAEVDGGDEPAVRFVMSETPPPGTFRVALETDGGDVGTNEPPTAPTLTYTVKSRDGATTIATAKSPLVRKFGFKVTAATWGYADYEDGELVLIEALEVPDNGGCA